MAGCPKLIVGVAAGIWAAIGRVDDVAIDGANGLDKLFAGAGADNEGPAAGVDGGVAGVRPVPAYFTTPDCNADCKTASFMGALSVCDASLRRTVTADGVPKPVTDHVRHFHREQNLVCHSSAL